MEKKELRTKMKLLRESLNEAEVLEKSKTIHRTLFSLPEFNKYDNVFIYNSFKNEVDTQFIIDKLLALGKNVYLPKLENKRMFTVKINKDTKYGLNSLKVEEPIGEKIELQNFVAILPCLAVDRKCNRLGFGGGYYDRFLSNHNCLKIALAYDFQIFDTIPSESFDVKMDFIISNNEFIRNL